MNAQDFEARFRGRPHVGSVSHVEGVEVLDVAALIRRVLVGLELSHDETLDEADGRRTYHAAAPVPAGEEGEIWLVVTEQLDVGCKIEVRVFHRFEESALADEYLATFGDRLLTELWKR